MNEWKRKNMFKILGKIIFYILLVVVSSCNFGPHETEGRYLVYCINSEVNNCKDGEDYFYANNYNIYGYSLKTGEKRKYVELDSEKNGRIKDFAVVDHCIFYVKKEKQEFELIKRDYQTGEEILLLSNDDIIQFNGEEPLRNINNPFLIRVYNDFLLFSTSNEYVYIYPIGGNIKTDSINVNELFEREDKSGKKQKTVFEGMIIERYYCTKLENYIITDIRDQEGRGIINSDTNGVVVGGKQINFYKKAGTKKYQYQKEGDELFYDIEVLQKEKFESSQITENYLTVENGKIIGWISISNHPLERMGLFQRDLEREVLFELDIETGKSRILYDTKNNLTKLIGYQDGILYLVKNEKVYAHELETKEEAELFDLPKGKNYIIDWQADYLIIREEFCYGQNGDIIMVYQIQ